MPTVFRFQVILTSDAPFDYTAERIDRMIGKIQSALQHEIDAGDGLMPDDSDAYTKDIAVSFYSTN